MPDNGNDIQLSEDTKAPDRAEAEYPEPEPTQDQDEPSPSQRGKHGRPTDDSDPGHS